MKYLLSTPIRTLAHRLAVLPILLLLVTGCVNDYDNCPTPERESDPVKLRFTIVTHTPMSIDSRQTRAADITGDQTGTVSENYLNLAGHDIRFLLFDNKQKLLRDFTPNADITLADGDNNKYITYTVRATIAEPYFANVATANTDFYIMVIANGRPYQLNAFGLTPDITTIEDVANQLASFTLKTYTIVDTVTGKRNGWAPSQPGISDGEYIPMAGLQHFTLSQGAFDGGPENFVELPENINMLRALAKIEIIDRIDIAGNFSDAPEKRIYVEKAELFGFCATGTVLPAYAQWNRNNVLETQQVESPTMASPMRYNPPTADINNPNWSSLIEFHEDQEAQDARADGCPIFSAYVTEYSLKDITTALPPYIRLTVNDPDLTDEESKFYRVELASYTNGVAGDNRNALLRNHIYRYEITAISNNSLQINYTLCPMEDGTADIPPFN